MNNELIYTNKTGKKGKGNFRFSVLLLIVLMAMIVPISPTLAQQNNSNVTLTLSGASIETFFQSVEKQTGYTFLYRKDMLDNAKTVTVSCSDKTLKSLLDEQIPKLNLTYKFVDKTIVISKNITKQQEKTTITGKVVDKTKNPLIGAVVVIKGTTSGSITDPNGEFSMKCSPDDVIEVQYSGMEDFSRKVGTDTQMTITMVAKLMKVDDVVVTGYFNKAKTSFTGSASTYTADQLKQVNPTNLLSALSILDPSFKMVENNIDGSNPNVIPDFQIRGNASMPSGQNIKSSFVGSPNMPTFILDGFEVSAEKVFDMDPLRIEMMTILKDAAATAIYGSRASNGVIVINTKQPEPNKIRVLYNLDLSFNLPDLRDYNLLNAQQKFELEKSAGYFTPFGTEWQTEMREQDYNYRLGLVEKGYDTYWLNKPLQMATGHKHSLSVEGGENSMRYSLDLTYENAPGIMKESGRERMGMGVMLQYNFKNVTFKNNITYDNVKTQNSPYGSFRDYATMNPYYPYLDENGNYLKTLEESSMVLGRQLVTNPLYNSRINMEDGSSYSEFVNNFGIDWLITSGLRLKGNVAIRHQKNDATLFKPQSHTDFANYTDEDFYRKGYYQATQGKEFFYDGNIVLSYFTQIKKHMINANLAWNIQEMSGDEYSVRAEGFPDDRLNYISFAAQNAKDYLPQGDDYISRLMGMVANAGYSYDDRYLLDISGRLDGSSKFGSDSRWAPFWSTGIGWNIHKEKFAENWKWANTLKLRASYGLTGSQSYEPYQAMIMYQYFTQDRYRYNIGAQMMGLGNPNLKWQQTGQLNVGADVSVWNDRLSVTFNYYQNRSKNLLSDITLAPSLGYESYKENLGELENKGYEVNLRVGIYKRASTWVNVSASGVRNTNILKKISNGLKSWNDSQDASTEALNVPRVRYIEGESTNAIWGVPSLGINPASGKEIFIAANGTRTDIWNSADQRVIGCSDPNLEGTIGLNAGWKGFQLNLYCRYRIGGEEYNSTLVERIENADKRYNTDVRVLQDRWREVGDVTFFKDVKDETATRPTSRFIETYNFLQLSSLNLSYDFPTALVKKMRMENLRLSFSANDLFRTSSIEAERGLDYPFSRTFRTSLRITF